MQHIINQAVAALREGKTLLYPTDTVWGVGCDASNPEAVERIYQLKERDHSKSMLVLALEEQLDTSCIGVPDNSWKGYLLDNGRPTTVIFPHASKIIPSLAPNLIAADGSIGIRIPNHLFCLQLLKALGHPIVSSSANLSGHPTPSSYHEIEEALKERVDHCVPNQARLDSNRTQSSRIVKLNVDGSITVIRP